MSSSPEGWQQVMETGASGIHSGMQNIVMVLTGGIVTLLLTTGYRFSSLRDV